jgi:hypothetical protein
MASTTPGTTTTGTTTTPTTTPSTSTSTTETSTSATETSTEVGATTIYTEESVKPSGGGGKVGLLMISPFVEPGKVVETEYANHFTLLKTLETMFGVEPLGYAGEEEMPTLSPELFLSEEELKKAEEAEKTSKQTKKKSGEVAKRRRTADRADRLLKRPLRSAVGSPARPEQRRGTS